MAKVFTATGSTPCRLMIIVERPSMDDYEKGRLVTGPSGQEFWSRVWRILRRGRTDFYITSLVNTFSMEKITPAEILANRLRVRAEMIKCKPSLVIVTGYDGARAMLPTLAGLSGDFFHGLPFACTYGTLQPRSTLIVPFAHVGSALRAPDRYQNQLTRDLEAVRDTLDGTKKPHTVGRPFVYRVGLAAFGKPGQVLGVDTEGSLTAMECVTAARGGTKGSEVACIETFKSGSPFLHASLAHAKSIAMHYSIHDRKVLENYDPRFATLAPVHDTMVEAYLLDLPQSLKVLAWREKGYEMSEYLDLVNPLDAALVKSTLQRKVGIWKEEYAALVRRAEKCALNVTPHGKRVTKKLIAKKLKSLVVQHALTLPPMRTIKALERMITRTEDTQADLDE